MTGEASAELGSIRSTEALLGRVVGGKYRVDRVLGRGGMGTIYVAEQQPLGRRVALKVLLPSIGDGATDPEFQKRFLLEAATLSQLAHPNIVTVHDYGGLDGADDAACFMVMELLDGRTINEAIAADGPFTFGRALRITREIARALRAAHRMGVIHRDLKPSNVMLCQRDGEGETVKVLDFGLVKVLRDDHEELTAEGRFLGSPRYMSPEQIQKLPVDGRSDLYSLGVILYRMISGEVPFAGDHAVQTLMAHLAKPVPPLADRGVAVPPPLDAIVMRLLEKEPSARFADADALMAAIDAAWSQVTDEAPIASGEHPRPSDASGLRPHRQSVSGISTVTGSLPPPPIAAPKRRWIFAAMGALFAVAAGSAGAAIVVSERSGRDEPVTAPERPAIIAIEETRPPPSPATSPAVQTFALTVESSPPGATLLRDGVVVGTTPIALELDARALRDEPVHFELRMDGRVPYAWAQGASEADLTIHRNLPRSTTIRAVTGDEPRGGNLSIKTRR